ncbi:MAG TPA: HNH endonuclease [Acetobacteraceae bacterium]|jgi:hypothetical protein
MAIEKLGGRLAPEQWRLIVAFEDYEVSTFGNVRRATPGRNTAPGRPLKSKTNTQGYPCVTLCGPNMFRKLASIHRLVAEAFIPRTAGHDYVHHINHDKTDAHVSNLEWVTRTENATRAVAAGRFPEFDRRGSLNGNSKLGEWDVIKIRKDYDAGVSVTTIADRYQIDRQHVWAIGTRKAWGHV